MTCVYVEWRDLLLVPIIRELYISSHTVFCTYIWCFCVINIKFAKKTRAWPNYFRLFSILSDVMLSFSRNFNLGHDTFSISCCCKGNTCNLIDNIIQNRLTQKLNLSSLVFEVSGKSGKNVRLNYISEWNKYHCGKLRAATHLVKHLRFNTKSVMSVFLAPVYALVLTFLCSSAALKLFSPSSIGTRYFDNSQIGIITVDDSQVSSKFLYC
jgi:hypothetical protein